MQTTHPLFADIASDYFARLKAEGAVFMPIDQALTGPAQDAIGSVVSREFLVLQQKLAVHAGRPMTKLPESQVAIHAKIVEMAKGQTG